MTTTYETKHEPQLLKIAGGWLALTPEGVDRRIGVPGPTRTEAAEKYHERIEWWRRFDEQAKEDADVR